MDSISFSNESLKSDLESKFHKVKGERFKIYCNCPISHVKVSRYKSAVFNVLGNPNEACDIQIVIDGKLRHANFAVSQLIGKNESPLPNVKMTDIMMEYKADGDATIKIKWN